MGVELTYEQKKLVADNLGLARSIGSRMYKNYLTTMYKIPMTCEDFISTAYLYLCIGVRNYNPAKGAKFSTFLAETMKIGITKYISRKTSFFKLPSSMRDKREFVAYGDVSSFSQPIQGGKDDTTTIGDTIPSEDYNIGFLELMASIDEILKDKDKQIFLMVKLHNKSQTQVAEELGVSQMTVSRRLNKAIEKLRYSLIV